VTVTDKGTNRAPAKLPYLLTDADEHSTPRLGAYEEYIDPDKRHLAITTKARPDGRLDVLYAGKPPKLHPKNFQVTFSDDQLSDIGVHGAGSTGDESDRDINSVIPGSLLNKLNPLKGLDAEGRRDFAQHYRALQPLLDNPADRLTVMDSQGIEAAVNYAAIATEYEFELPRG
jgi:hypothetical protein